MDLSEESIVVENLLSFYKNNRGVGHTQLMIGGLVPWLKANPDKIVVVLTQSEAHSYEMRQIVLDALDSAGFGTTAINSVRFVSMCNTGSLLGLKAVAVIDNSTLCTIIEGYEHQLRVHRAHSDTVNAKLHEARSTVTAQARVIEQLRERLAELEYNLPTDDTRL